MKNKVLSLFFFIFVALILWYLFLKKYDYQINFVANTSPGTIYQGVIDYNESLANTNSQTFQIKSKIPYQTIEEEHVIDGITYEYLWKIQGTSDCTSSVKVFIKEHGNSVFNRLSAPFITTDFKKKQLERLVEFKKELKKHLEEFNVEVDGEAMSDEAFVAYIPLESTMQQKGQTMIMNNSKVTLFLTENGIEIKDKPFLEITHWDQDREKLNYNFCFPIDKNDSLPEHDVIKYKKLSAKKCLKATYHGNYRTSDRAWFALYDHAKRNQIPVHLTPTEHFFNNPHFGGNELEWKAEVFLPIKEQ